MFRKKPASLSILIFMISSMILFAVSSPVLAGVTGTEGGDPCDYSIAAGGKIQFNFTYSADYEGTRPAIIVEGPKTGQFPASEICSQITCTKGSYYLSSITVTPNTGYAIQDVTVDSVSKGAVTTAAIPHTADLIIIGDPDEPGSSYVAAGSYSDFTVTFAATPSSSSASSSSSVSSSAAASSSKTSSAPASSSAVPSSAAHSSDAASASPQTVSGSGSGILSAVSPSALSSSQSSSLPTCDRSAPGPADIAESEVPKDNGWFIWLGAFFLLLMLLLLFFFLWKRRKKKKDEQPTDSQESAETKPGEKVAPEKEDVTKDSRT